ncbi:MAG: hypothetical protein V1793_15475 [Pseudomonadota bacterium]
MAGKSKPDNDMNTIRFGYGIGNLCFGSTMDECRAYLGDPEDELSEDFEDEEFVTWYYGDGDLILSFEASEGYCLGSIIAGHRGMTLDGEPLFGKSLDAVKGYLKKNNYFFLEEVDETDPSIRSLEVGALESTFMFENKKLDGIQWSYYWIDDETPKWPQKNA